MWNKLISKDIDVKIITGSGKQSVTDEFREFISEHRNDVILDIKVTECDDQYTMWIFYEEVC